MNRVFIYPFFALSVTLAIFLSSCSTSKVIEQPLQVTKSAIVLSDEQMFEFKYNFFEANKFNLQGNYQMAIGLYNSCLTIDSTSSSVHYSLASIYIVAKDFVKAQEHIDKAITYNNDNVWYLYLAGSIYLQNKEYAKAKDAFNRLITINDTELEYYINLADVYLQSNDLSGAIKVYNTVEEKFGISEIIVMQKYKVFLAMNKSKDALNELLKLETAFPEVVEYKRLVADFYVQVKAIDLAIDKYNGILAQFKKDGFSYIGLAECYRIKNDATLSFDYLKKAFSSDDVPSEVKFNLLLNLVKSLGDNLEYQKSAYDLATILYEKYPKDADISLLFANFLLQYQEFAEARTILNEIIVLRKDRYQIWEQLLLLDNQFLDWTSMFTHSDEAIRYFPNQSFLYFFNGFSAFQLNNYDKAISSLSFGFKIITKADPLYPDFLTFLAESYYKTGDKSKAYGYYDELLKDDSENVMVLNNYAYYLSLDKSDLVKAENMSKLTVKKEPNNPTYLDTYAWVLFQQKKYPEALIYMEKAISYSTDTSDVVYEHYGDILFFNKQNEKALEYWVKAREIGIGSGKLDEKISVKKYIE